MRFQSAAAVLLVMAASSLAATPTVAAERQFQSGGLKVEINRATPPGKGEFGISLILTNTQDNPMELFTARDIQALADTGEAYQNARVGGLPSCLAGSASGCDENIQRGRLTPLSIDAGQSATVTLAFSSRINRGSGSTAPCSLDLSMPVYLRALTGRTPGPWRLITVGVPNIKVC